MKVVLDLETCCAVQDCPDIGESTRCKGKHALDWNRGRITLIGICYEVTGELHYEIFDKIQQFKDWLFLFKDKDLEFIGQNFKFDLHFLRASGVDLQESWYADTQHMASVCLKKVSEEWLEEYNDARKRINKREGQSIHRQAGKYSLKTMAPYFLGVDPFWELAHHDDTDYLKKDLKYTWGLYHYFHEELDTSGQLEFITDRMMPWARMLYNAEVQGVLVDIDLLTELESSSIEKEKVLKSDLDEVWGDAGKAYRMLQLKEIEEESKIKKDKAILSLKNTARKQIQLRKSLKAKKKVITNWYDKRKNAEERYDNSYIKRASQVPPVLNLSSDKQLLWLFKDYLHLDCRVEDWDKDLKKRVIKESTGKEIIQKYVAKGRDDFKIFKKYRETEKLITSFFPSYRKYMFNQRIHTGFNMSIAKTGRLTCSEPNMQQVPRSLHSLMMAGSDRMFTTKDVGAIEPGILAYYSEDPALCKLIIEGRSFHSANVKGIFPDLLTPERDIKSKHPDIRDAVKECGLSILYGAEWRRVQKSFQKRGIHLTETECRDIVIRMRDKYAGVWAFKESIDKKMATEKQLTNLLGRPFSVQGKDIYMHNLNRLIQGSASDLVLRWAENCWTEFKKKGLNACPVLFIHDEVVFDIPKEQLTECNNIIIRNMATVKLPTAHGDIRLSLEGNTAREWSK